VTVLPQGWSEATLGAVATWGSGGTPRATEASYYGGDIMWAVIGDLTDGLITRTAGTITPLGLANSSAKIVEAGSLLVAMYGASIGRLGIAGSPMATNQAIAFANGHPGLMGNKFLFWFLRWQRRHLISAGKGAAQPNISQGILKSWRVVVPPLEEQRMIAAVIEERFSRLDQAELLLRGARRRAERMRQALLAAITPLDGPWTTLGEIADIVGGVTKDSKRQADPTLVEVPYLRVANVQRGYLDLREVTTIRVPPQKAKALQLEPGDILFNEGGDRDKLGRGWVWQGQVAHCIHQNHVFRARLLTRRFEPKYVSLHGNNFGQQWFEHMGKD
jgi:type I restriction enzyme S subunit